MRLTSNQYLILVLSILLLGICCLVFPNQQQPTCYEPSKPTFIPIDMIALFQKKVIPNRLAQFIQYLNHYGIPVQNNFELLLLLSNPIARQNIHQQFQIDSNVLLLHAELADLMQIEMTELDAQILFYSQRNYQNPFNGKTINLQILAEANAERLLQDIGGWMAGNNNQTTVEVVEILQNYQLSVEDIESWIAQAKHQKYKIFSPIP